MSADVLVRRCTLTIARRDGWSWGPDPQLHVEGALRYLEEAVAAALAEAGVGDGAAIVLREPVRLELAPDGEVSAASRAALVARLRREVGAEPGHVPPAADDSAEESPSESVPASRRSPAFAAPPLESGSALARMLARWSRAGRLEQVAASWPPTVVRAWVEAIREAASRPGADVGVLTNDAVERIAEAVLRPASAGARGAPAALAQVLTLLGALAAAVGDKLPAAGAQERARAVVLGTAAEQADADAATAGIELGTAEPVPADNSPEPATPPVTRAAADVVPALPFLVLAQLARIGYADAVVAASAATRRWLAPGLGAALAGKVLPPPARGWSRTPAESGAVALASGCRSEDVPALLEAVAAAAPELLAPLRSALQGAYADGRSTKDEVLVTTGKHGIVCGEEAGLLPAAWVSTRAELEDALASLGHPPVREGDGFAALMLDLHERRALLRLAAADLERHLGAAVGTALGLLAVTLWGETSPASPLLALERLSELEARVRPSPRDGGLEVSVPRGRRWLDLRRGELLGPTPIAWLPGGRLEVGTW